MTELSPRERFNLMKKNIVEGKNDAGNPFLQLKSPEKTGEYNEYKVRLLPQKDGTIDLWSEYFRHFYKSKITGQWVEVFCPTTNNLPCPICEMNRKLWDEEDEASHKIASYYGRRKNFIVALYVKDDPVTPDNNGTVQVLRYGKQIQDKVEAGIMNKSIDFAAMDISEEGIDFLIRAQKQKGTGARSVNYNLTEFDRERTAMVEDDADGVYDKLCPDTLKSFLPKEKSYGEVKTIMAKTITGIADDDSASAAPGDEAPAEDEIPMNFEKDETLTEKAPVEETLAEKAPVEETPPKKKPGRPAKPKEEAKPAVESKEEAKPAVESKEEAKPAAESKEAPPTSDDDDDLMAELSELRAQLDAEE